MNTQQTIPPREHLPAAGSLLPPINVTFSTDTLLFIAGLSWFVWDRFLKNRIANKLDGVFAPIEEERRLNNLLAQVGVITQASRVVLTAFHNGEIDNAGYHLTKLSTINTYTASGSLPMAVPIRDLPVGRIMFEIEQLLDLKDEIWSRTEYTEDLPQPCKDHLLKNNISVMYNRLVYVGKLPIGILSIQFDRGERRWPSMSDPQHANLLNDLYNEISSIMRRRIIHPGPLKRFVSYLRSTGSSSQ